MAVDANELMSGVFFFFFTGWSRLHAFLSSIRRPFAIPDDISPLDDDAFLFYDMKLLFCCVFSSSSFFPVILNFFIMTSFIFSFVKKDFLLFLISIHFFKNNNPFLSI